MPEFTSYAPGSPSWVDHAAKEIAASNSFYVSLFGWEAEDQGEETGHYTILKKSGATVAGNMGIMMEGQPSAWTTYVSVEDADKTTGIAKEAGAMVFVEPMDVMISVAWLFSQTRPEQPSGSGSRRPSTVPNWPTKRVPSLERIQHPRPAGRQGLLHEGLRMDRERRGYGWNELHRVEAGRQGHRRDACDARPCAGGRSGPLARLLRGRRHRCHGLQGDAAGATTLVPPTDIPPGRFAVLSDPEGAGFAVIKLNPTAT